jgi:penicillin-binding protein 1C
MPEFSDPLSTVVEARDGSLLGARIAGDGQWRFPPSDTVPLKFEKALLAFEDRYFRFHPGINPVSLARAMRDNLQAGTVVSGGSTITMQVARLARGNPSRTYAGKMAEMLSALKLEIFRTKRTILGMYVANAPFGGNTVGLGAAAWRYTGKNESSLTWAEAAALAVLPNAPSIIYPGRNDPRLKERRDMLLRRLHGMGCFDSLELTLALEEPLPGRPTPLPSAAPHLTDFYMKTRKGERILTTIDPLLQDKVSEIINMHQEDLASNFIFNSACIVVEVESGNVLAYVGNSATADTALHGSSVDIIRARRSTGSILKPLLYAAMLNSGEILPNTLIADIPTRFPGFSPVNFDRSYSGAVPAARALSQSLNIPAVRMLRDYDPGRFLLLLRKAGFSTFGRDADHYGLSLILGGGETSLWELAGVYASLSRVLNRYNREGTYDGADYHEPRLLSAGSVRQPADDRAGQDGEPGFVADQAGRSGKAGNYDPPFSAGSVWLTYEALKKVNRPETESGWQYFDSSSRLAWKTGTSYGFRDAWAVGTTPRYVVAVWAGNADGEGRPGLTGIAAAAPVMFDIVNYMGAPDDFSRPGDLISVTVCSQSGFRAGSDCPETEEVYACRDGLKSEVCPWHRLVHLNSKETHRVSSLCAGPDEIRSIAWFVLPPAMEYFYRQKHHEYRVLPPWAPGCATSGEIPSMEFIYPSPGTEIFIPRGETGEKMMIIAELAHRSPAKKIFWHLDNDYIGTTRSIHQVQVSAQKGPHILTAVDEDGNSIKCNFTII